MQVIFGASVRVTYSGWKGGGWNDFVLGRRSISLCL